MKYRIALVETEFLHVGLIKKYAVQRRVGLFWWVSIATCDNFTQAISYRKNVSKRAKDRVLKVVKE